MSTRSKQRQDEAKILEQSNPKGKIKSIYCKHFVTYEECIFNPTKHLNIIIGPNGTGKSTLVAAIVLGLGGEPKVLSRSPSIQDYIKNGKDSATIRVVIYANALEEEVCFERTFDMDGKSSYKVNGTLVNKSKYLHDVAEYKIQITNLCQFLPQDRVQDFAKMNPQEIFLNTISSVCSSETISNFKKLKELRKKQLDTKGMHEQNLAKLKKTMTRVEELRQVLQRYNARKECMDKLKLCELKKLQLEVDDIKTKLNEINKDLKMARKKADQNQHAYEKVVQKQTAIIAKTRELTNDVEQKEKIANRLLGNRNNFVKQIEDLKQKIQEAKTSFESKKREWSDSQSDLQNETKMLEVITQDLKNAVVECGSDVERNRQLAENEKKLEELKYDVSRHIKMRSEINKKLDEDYSAELQMLKKRIERSENVTEQKMQLLQNKFPDVYNGVQWLRNNRNLFEGRVYEPILLELNVPDSNHTKYLENTIGLRDLLAFTCENISDVSLLVNELCINQKLSVNVGHSAAAHECHYRANEPISNLRKYGFTAYLIDLVEGPPAILNYLCSLYSLHKIPIGNENVNKCTDSIPVHIRQYFGGDLRYDISISKYSKEPSLMQTYIKGKQLLFSRDLNEIQTLRNRLNELVQETDILKNERSQIEAKISNIEFKRTEVVNKKRAIEAKTARIVQIKEQLKRQEHKVSQMKDCTIGIPEMQKIFRDTANECIKKILKLQKERIDVLRLYQDAVADKKYAITKKSIYQQQNQELTNAINEANALKRDSEKMVEVITRNLETIKNKHRSKMTDVQVLTTSCNPNDENFPYKQFFQELSNNLEELTESINEFSARLDCMDDVDQEIINEFDARSEDVEELKKTIEDNVYADQNAEVEISALYQNWYTTICGIIETLNSNFGKFMESMSYVGEILLIKQSDHDFDSYGIQIMVQYRNNVPLQALDRHVQSGGERAVAIALYTLSLQHLTHVPFRCVDEINQGMDARNERKIFEMLVHETTQPHRAQYFFVTPKLLPNLPYNERMSVHIVFNGKILEQNTFSI